jgi:Type-A lantibiotic
MEKNFELEALKAINDLTDEELEAVVGAGNGVITTISHECHMNSWQFVFTCC